MRLSKWMLNTVVLAAGLGLLAPAPAIGQGEWTVCSQGCHFRRIQPAIDAASDGDTIVIQSPGLYYENLVITKSLKIVARHASPVIILPEMVFAGPVILVKGDKPIEVTLEELIVKGLAVEQNAMIVTGQAKLVLQRVEVGPSAGFGIYIRDQAQAVIRDSRLHDNSIGVLAGGSAQITIENSAIFDNMLYGLDVVGDVQLHVRNSTIYWNGTGIFATDKAKVLIEDVQIYNHRRFGIILHDVSTIEVLRATIARNDDGVTLVDNANLTMRESFIHGNSGYGVSAWLRKCGFREDRYKGGTVKIDETNVILKNGRGDVCLP